MTSDQSENAPPALYFAAFAAAWVFGVISILEAAGLPTWIAALLAGVSAPLVAIILWRGYVRLRSRQSV
jgi:hypothetical protein